MNTVEAEVMRPQEALQQQPPQSIEGLMSLAITRGVPVETMERLMAMRRELKAEAAKNAYDAAMAAFQAECPVIKKTKDVKTNTGAHAYSYAPLESIVDQVREPLKNHGFSYSTKMDLLPDGVKVVVKVTHEQGHSEESPMQVPFGTKTNIMSQTQVAAAATTFAKRYAFCNAFGILTGDEDTDARPEAPPPPQRQTAPAATPPETKIERFLKATTGLHDGLRSIAEERGWIKPNWTLGAIPEEVLPKNKKEMALLMNDLQHQQSLIETATAEQKDKP